MIIFHWLTFILTGHRLYDTTSGFKVFNRQAMRLTIDQSLGDYHAVFLIYLLRKGCKISEYPIVVGPREYGRSMYSWIDAFVYPVKTLKAIVLVLLGKTGRS